MNPAITVITSKAAPKTKEIITVEGEPSKEDVVNKITMNKKIKNTIIDKNIERVIYVPNKIINLVVKK